MICDSVYVVGSLLTFVQYPSVNSTGFTQSTRSFLFGLNSLVTKLENFLGHFKLDRTVGNKFKVIQNFCCNLT